MLSYQHIYHAGNFADVHKHAILVELLKSLTAKNPKLAVIDTHAGRGSYDLLSEEAQKTMEFSHGAQHFWENDGLPDGLKKIVSKFNPEGDLAVWPGSAMIARQMLRPGDKLTCVERHPGEFAELQKTMADAVNTELQQKDGFQSIVEFSPPAIRKGLVIIDPSYEIKTEYVQTAKQVHLAWKKWPQGVFLIWYPLLEADGHRQLLTQLRKSEVKDVMVSEIRLAKAPSEGYRMYGSGIAIVNPPWPINVLDDLTNFIADRMPQKAHGDTYWLDNQPINPETGTI
ncbi:MAG: rRNA ((2030)-N(6))-methyltransferase RlmJ [Alphaproteobacteria bacterium]|jgi:23S rRNA (adenine2030-N6)-methyltransferase|nr:rRNA ((2030)-N(6))-methyltransferase RlmJ [Alphaproteobacteria bacterium]